MKKILTIKLLIFSILTMSGCGPGSLKDTVVPVQMKCGQITEEIGITGRTEEETELIKRIMAEDDEGFQDFLMEEWEYPHIQRWVAVWGYDFTGDGQDEIIVSKGDVNISAVLSFNYIYDCTGRKMSEFVGGDLSMTQILKGWKGNGTFLLYDAVHYASHNNANIYTEIEKADGSMEAGVQLVEFDCRPGGEEGEDGYYIFKDFTKEEEIKLWYGIAGINELVQTKEFVREDKTLEEYKQMFTETENFSLIGTMLYDPESGGFIWTGAGSDIPT